MCKTVKGIELSEDAVEKARKKKLPIEKVDLKDFINRGEIFNVICGFQVLEHLSEPFDYLEAIIKILAPGGSLILCVPNKESFLKYQDNLLDMPPHHMTKWNLDTLKYLEKLFPLKLIRESFEPLAKLHISGYVSAYARHLRSRLPISQFFLTKRICHNIVSLLKKTELFRFLRGQSLYVLFKRI